MDQRSIKEEELEIDLKDFFFVLMKKFWLIVMAGVGAALLAFLISKFIIVPVYESTTKIYIINKETESSTLTFNDLQSGTQLTKDYMTLVTSRPVIEQVIASLNLDLKYEQLVKLVKVENPEGTRLLSITVKYKDPYMAKQIADAVREASSTHIQEVMDIEKVNKAEDANIPEEPASPNTLLNTVIGGVVGGAFCVVVILLIYILDDTIKTPDDIEKYLEISVLSSIPYQETANKKKKKRRNKKDRSKK